MCSNQDMPTVGSNEKICRQFYINDEEGSQIRYFQIDIGKFLIGRQINLIEILRFMETKGLTITGYRFEFTHLNIIISPDLERYNVKLSQMSNKKITVICRQERQNESQQSEQIQPSEILGEPVLKKQKQSQRFIREVLEAVKLWRWMYNSEGISLTDGAKMVSWSKKSLDDYFLQLRNGQYYGFDFKNNLDEKIGKLRDFIRKKTIEGLKPHLSFTIQSFQIVRSIEEIKKDMLNTEQTNETSFPQHNEHQSLFGFSVGALDNFNLEDL